jgi:hypothetical protein
VCATRKPVCTRPREGFPLHQWSDLRDSVSASAVNTNHHCLWFRLRGEVRYRPVSMTQQLAKSRSKWNSRYQKLRSDQAASAMLPCESRGRLPHTPPQEGSRSHV